MSKETPFNDIDSLATHLRKKLESKRFILLYAHNGTGKTRLSMVFKDQGKTINTDGERERGDTLYFNAFTEDLFSWDNDLENDSERRLMLNKASRFFASLESMEMDTRIRPLLHRYVDFDFRIDYEEWAVFFSRTVQNKDDDKEASNNEGDAHPKTEIETNIKISRGEENIFIWCFFLAIVQLALDEADAYKWVKYIYIDDPISSLDEHNAIAVATQLVQMLKNSESQKLKSVISTHHTLFFNVLYNGLKGKANNYFLGRDESPEGFSLRETGETPFFHHVAALAELHKAANEGRLYTHHFNTLRTILEKTASFHGYSHFSACIKANKDDEDGILHTRLINILNHGNYSLFEPREMLPENEQHFREILEAFIVRHHFDPDLFENKPAT